MKQKVTPVVLLAALLLSGCDVTEWQRDTREACRRMLAAARSSQDTVTALAAHPGSTHGQSCAMWLRATPTGETSAREAQP